MAGTDTAIKVAQTAVLQAIDQPMHPNIRAASPCLLQDRRLANAPDTLNNIQFSQTVASRFHIRFPRQIDSKAAGQAPYWFQPMIGKTVWQILGRSLDPATAVMAADDDLGRAGDGEAQHQRWESGARSCYAHAYEIACNLLEGLRLRAVRLGNHDGRAAV